MWDAWKRKIHAKFWNETQKEVDNLEEIGMYGRIILNKYDGWLWNGFIRLKPWTIGGLL
jgi:hypothetical protein